MEAMTLLNLILLFTALKYQKSGLCAENGFALVADMFSYV
jgi:hypothetical protein